MILNKPHRIFAFVSLIVGLIMVFLMPPTTAIDENQHVHRVTDIATLKFLNPDNHTDEPIAIWAEHALVVQDENLERSPHWNFSEMLEKQKTFPQTLPEKRQVSMDKNPYAVGNPLLYIPLGTVLALCDNLLNLPPWEKFYILRITALLLSVLVISVAISRMPEHQAFMAAACMLPAMMTARSGVNIDGLVIGSALLFISQVFRMSRQEGLVKTKDIILLIIFGFLTAQSKGAYVPLLFCAFLVPHRVFSSKASYVLVMALVIIPAMAVSLGWSSLARQVILSGIRYNNYNGEVWPDGQYAWITSHPLAYLQVFLETLFTTPLVPKLFLEIFGSISWGHNHFTIPAISYAALILLIGAIMAVEPVKQPLQQTVLKRCFILLILCCTIGLAMTMLYVQWSAYQSPVIDGFQGRYLYPLLPLLAVFIKPVKEHADDKKKLLLLWVFAIVSSLSTLWAPLSFYYL